MAVAGAAVPALTVWLDSGRLRTGYQYSAHGDVVEDSVERCAERLRNGEKVYFHRYADNFARLSAMFPEPKRVSAAEYARRLKEITPPFKHSLIDKLVEAVEREARGG